MAGSAARHGDLWQLVVIDDSRFEIPWELISLGAVEDHGGDAASRYLGAEIPVTRWQASTLAAQRSSWLDEPPPPSEGPVVAYLSDELGAIEQDVQSLASADVRAYRDAQAFKKAELKAGAADRALVYLACHGTPGETLVDVALGRAPQKGSG